MTQETAKPSVLVAGGGYAGLLAANRLAGKLGDSARIVLVTLGDTLTDRIRLHEAAARGKNVEHALTRLLNPAIERIDARVLGVNPGARQVTIEQGGAEQQLRYDWLVLALGSRFAQTMPAQGAHALALTSPRSAHALYRTLRGLPKGARVAVVGGGLTAIELSSEIAEAHPRLRVALISRDLAPGLRGPAQQQLKRALEKSGVQLELGKRVTALTTDAVHFADGSQQEVTVSVLASGFSPAALGEHFQLPVDVQGRVPVDAQLRVQGLDNVFAVGDLAAPPAGTIGNGLSSTRMACATAMPLGAHAADQIVRAVQGQALVPYRYSYIVQCISVGRRQGIVASVNADDQPTGRVLSGRTGALVKELICRFVLAAIRLERMFAGLYAWPGRRALPRLPSATPTSLPR